MSKTIISSAFATVLMDSMTNGSPESVGTVTDFIPGQTMILKTEAAEPVHYKFSKSVTYVTADARVIDPSQVRKGSNVRVHYVKSGDDILVDKVIVTERD